ncbi:MAG TPA: hypothetical protein VL330_10215 [Actinomycetes bacterium]|nr:hypothetical protein [Actinomycetes bacterium]
MQGRDRVDGHVPGGDGLARPRPDQAVGRQAILDGVGHGRGRHHHPGLVVQLQQVAQGRGVEMVEMLVGGQDQLDPGQVGDAHRRREAPVRVAGEERVDGQAGGRGAEQEAGLPDPGQLGAHPTAAPGTGNRVRVQP